MVLAKAKELGGIIHSLPKYISLFVSLNNIFDQKFKSGGFEQGRSANYQSLQEDSQNPKRVFGPKYWYGRGPTYFLNLNYRF